MKKLLLICCLIAATDVIRYSSAQNVTFPQSDTTTSTPIPDELSATPTSDSMNSSSETVTEIEYEDSDLNSTQSPEDFVNTQQPEWNITDSENDTNSSDSDLETTPSSIIEEIEEFQVAIPVETPQWFTGSKPKTVSLLITTEQLESFKGIGPCVCDLTPQTCDIGCCCDADCTSADIQAFITTCQPFSFETIQTCVPSYVFFRYNAPDKAVATPSGQVCFYEDSFTSRNSYAAPTLVTNSTEADNIVTVYVGYVLPIYAYTYESNYPTFYKSDSSILIFFPSNTTGHLTLPLIGAQQQCGNGADVKYLHNKTVTCSQPVTSLASTCETNAVFNLENFVSSFKVVNTPNTLNSILNRTEDSLGNITEPFAYNASGLLSITNLSLTCETDGVCDLTSLVPAFNATSNQCNNVLKSLMYSLTYDGVNGIVSVTYTAVLGSLSTSASSLSQTLGVNFISNNGTAGSPSSGNPGYIVGKPVLAGTFSNTSNTIITSGAPSSQLTVLSGGACSASAARTSVLFGTSLNSGCLMTISQNISTYCSALESQILQYIEGGTSFPTRIATFGNSLISNPDDWLQIATSGRSVEGSPTSFPGGCSQIVIGAELVIITSLVGSVTSPQNRIIGAEMKYIRGDIKFTCTDPACTDTPQNFPISTTVSFIDSSVTGGPQESTDPTFLTQFHSDFFYIFKVENLAEL